MGKTIRESSFGTGMAKSTQWGMSFCSPTARLVLIGNADDIKMAGRNQNLSPMWKKLMKLVDLGETTLFLDHVCLETHST